MTSHRAPAVAASQNARHHHLGSLQPVALAVDLFVPFFSELLSGNLQLILSPNLNAEGNIAAVAAPISGVVKDADAGEALETLII